MEALDIDGLVQPVLAAAQPAGRARGRRRAAAIVEQPVHAVLERGERRHLRAVVRVVAVEGDEEVVGAEAGEQRERDNQPARHRDGSDPARS